MTLSGLSAGTVDWDLLKVFLVCCDKKSFVKTAAELSEAPSTIGRKIDQLEAVLRSELFKRTSQGLVLTEDGAVLEGYVRQMWQLALGALATTKSSREELGGAVTIRTWESMAVDLVRAFPSLRHDHPDLRINFIADHRVDEDTTATSDILITYTPVTRDEFIVKQYGSLNFCWCASRAYVEEYGAPETLQQLVAHRIVFNRVFSTHTEFWQPGMLALKEMAKFTVETDSTWTAAAAILAGNGVGALPIRAVMSNPGLVALDLPLPAKMPVLLAYPMRTKSIKRIEVVLDWLRRELNSAARPDLNPALQPSEAVSITTARTSRAG